MNTGRSRSAIEFQDVVAATFVVGTDLISADFLDVQEAIDNLPVEGGCIAIMQGAFTRSSAITLPDKPVKLMGNGSSPFFGTGATIISWTSAPTSDFIIPASVASFPLYTFTDIQFSGDPGLGQIGFDIQALCELVFTRCDFVNFGKTIQNSGAAGCGITFSVCNGTSMTTLFHDTQNAVSQISLTDSNFFIDGPIAIDGNPGCDFGGGLFFATGTNITIVAGTSSRISGVNFAGVDLSADSHTTVKGCKFEACGVTLTGGISVVSGCVFEGPTVTAVSVSSAGNVVCNNVFSGSFTNHLVESGAAENNTYDDNFPFELITIIGLNTRINGSKQSFFSAVTTNAFVSMMAISNPRGIRGSGTVENKGANSINVKELFTDAFGTTSTLTTTVAAGNELPLSLEINIGTGRPPYVSYEVQVKDTVNGVHGLPELYFVAQGAL